MRPCFSIVRLTIASTDAGLETSVRTHRQSVSVPKPCSYRSATTTCMPSCCRPSTTARPMLSGFAPPVTIATRFMRV